MNDSVKSQWAASFGIDPAGYDRGRPGYPERVYGLLTEVCGLGPNTRAFEIGPGSGIATRALLTHGVEALTAIEPDHRLAAFLAASTAAENDRLTIVNTTFASAEVPESAFDLGVAATTMHWLEPGPALAKVNRLLRPGGWWAMWWTIFGNPLGFDAFHEATLHLFPPTPGVPTGSVSEPFALGTEARLSELAAAGFVEARHEMIEWTAEFDVTRTIALYSTFPHIRTMPEPERERRLRELGRVVETEFGGVVHRPLLTPLFIARKPERGAG